MKYWEMQQLKIVLSCTNLQGYMCQGTNAETQKKTKMTESKAQGLNAQCTRGLRNDNYTVYLKVEVNSYL